MTRLEKRRNAVSERNAIERNPRFWSPMRVARKIVTTVVDICRGYARQKFRHLSSFTPIVNAARSIPLCMRLSYSARKSVQKEWCAYAPLLPLLCSELLRGTRFGGRINPPVNRVEHFLPVHGHLLRCHDSEADFVPSDFDHRNGDVVVDDDALVLLSR